MDYPGAIFFILLFLVLLIGMVAGGLLYRWWTGRKQSRPSYLVVDRPAADTPADNLNLLKKDTRDRQRLKASSPEWEDN